MANKLTKRKQKWADRRKPDIIRGDPLNPSMAIADRYYKNIMSKVDLMTSETEKILERFYSKGFVEEFFDNEGTALAQDASPASQARILMNKIMAKFEEVFGDIAKPYSERMIKEVAKNSSSTLHESLKKMSGGLSLNTSVITDDLMEVVKASVAENVQLIKSIPQQYLNGVQGQVMRSITTGNGMADLMPYLKKHHGITQRRAKTIALDQTRKAYESITRGRMKNLGIDKFEWRHTGGSNEPRKYHQKMDGKIYSMDDPPIIDPDTGERGFPGQLINCFTGGMPVSLVNGCHNIWRYRHDGYLVILRLSDNNEIEATPNHPILAQKGWSPAEGINIGDVLLCCRNKGRTKQFHEVFDKYSHLYKTKTLSDPINFHGDKSPNIVSWVQPKMKMRPGPKVQIDAMNENHKRVSHTVTVVDKVIVKYSGFVYTMETSTGWFGVGNSGVISRNCRCRMLPVITFGDE